MKVLLLQNVKGVGQKGEIKNVAEGFAHNRLIPQKLAKIATSSTVKEVKAITATKKNVESHKLEEIKKMFQDIKSQTYILKQKTNKEGVLFAKCDASTIEKLFKKEGFSKIDKSMITLNENPIKKIGNYTVTLRHKQNKVDVTVSIISE